MISSEQLAGVTYPGTKSADQRPALLLARDDAQLLGRSLPSARRARRGHGAGTRARLACPPRRCPPAQCGGRQDVPPSTIGQYFDTVTLCLSKGLGCPLGAILAGPTENIDRAWREKHLFGGAMRQAGMIAAAGLYALDHNVERLADDHARAKRLAAAWHEAGIPVSLEQVETNFVQVDIGALGLGRDEALTRLRGAGVGLSSTIDPRVIRAVTHLGVDDESIELAIALAPPALLG